MSKSEITLLSMYFSLTSLTTTGLGDYFPITNAERLFSTVMLVSGITLFSYVLSELRYMIKNFKYLNCDLEQNEKLEEFFIMLEKFNQGQRINTEWQNKVRKFMKVKWNGDKNNFLLTAEDCMLLEQLPTKVRISIYTDFLFKEFLWSFRRFFNFNIMYSAQEGMLSKEGKKFKLKILTSVYDKIDAKNNFLIGLYFPFYTLQNAEYSQFMICIMNNLEIRKFSRGEYIA